MQQVYRPDAESILIRSDKSTRLTPEMPSRALGLYRSLEPFGRRFFVLGTRRAPGILRQWREVGIAQPDSKHVQTSNHLLQAGGVCGALQVDAWAHRNIFLASSSI